MLNNIILDWSGTLLEEPKVHSDEMRLVPRALEFLQFCRATRRRLFLLSAISPLYFAAQSERLGVAHFFERTYLGVAKKRERISVVLAENGLAPRATAFVGDTASDLAAARHGGVMAIATLTGADGGAQLCQADPDLIVRDLGELQRLMEFSQPADELRIEELELMGRVGVPDKERARPQRLVVSVTLQPREAFSGLGDDLARTVDYAAVCEAVKSFVADREDKLIETMSHQLAEHLVQEFDLARVELELRKFILPETRFVAVRVARPAFGKG